MEILEQLNQAIKEAMKKKDKPTLDATRYLKSMLMENKTSSKPIAELEVVIKHHKKLKDSLELYPEGSENRQKIATEITIVSQYMPRPLEQNEVEQMIQDIISRLDSPQMGAVMKELSPQIKGRFDGKQASQLVITKLKN